MIQVSRLGDRPKRKSPVFRSKLQRSSRMQDEVSTASYKAALIFAWSDFTGRRLTIGFKQNMASGVFIVGDSGRAQPRSHRGRQTGQTAFQKPVNAYEGPAEPYRPHIGGNEQGLHAPRA